MPGRLRAQSRQTDVITHHNNPRSRRTKAAHYAWIALSKIAYRIARHAQKGGM